MNPTLKNVLAVIAGIVIGSIVNMGIIQLGPSIIPPPAGTDTTTMEGLLEAMPLFETKHFFMPFLAHALGTLVGAFVVARFAVLHQMKLALGVGVWFLLGGVMAAFMLPSPAWYTLLDLSLAYLPMAFLGGKLGLKKK